MTVKFRMGKTVLNELKVKKFRISMGIAFHISMAVGRKDDL